MAGILHFEYKEDYSIKQGIDRRECSGNATINKTAVLVPLQNFNAQENDLNRHGEKMKAMHRG